MKLQFKLKNEVKILEIEEYNELLIRDLISKLSNKYNINGITSLLLNEVELAPEKTLKSYGINEKSIINIAIVAKTTPECVVSSSLISGAVTRIFDSTILDVSPRAMFKPPTGDWLFRTKK